MKVVVVEGRHWSRGSINEVMMMGKEDVGVYLKGRQKTGGL